MYPWFALTSVAWSTSARARQRGIIRELCLRDRTLQNFIDCGHRVAVRGPCPGPWSGPTGSHEGSRRPGVGPLRRIRHSRGHSCRTSSSRRLPLRERIGDQAQPRDHAVLAADVFDANGEVVLLLASWRGQGLEHRDPDGARRRQSRRCAATRFRSNIELAKADDEDAARYE